MKYFLILVLLLLASCESSTKRLSFKKEKDAEVIKLTETFIDVPLEMEIKDSIIYISDFRGDSLLWCYSLRMKNFRKRMLPKGEGPYEFLSPIQFILSDTSIFIHNRWHYTAQNYDFNIGDFSLNPVGKLLHFPTDIDMIYTLSDNRYVASGRFADSRFVIMDSEGKIISKCGDYPTFFQEEKRMSNFPKFMSHQSMFGFHRGRKCLTSVTSHVFELWDYIGDTLQLKQRLLLSPYKYEYKIGDESAAAIASNDTETGAKRIYTTENFIYILYDPNTVGESHNKKLNLNSEIWIFDWDGIPIEKIKLDNLLICFCVDEKNGLIYCIMNAPDPSIGVISI